MTVKDLREILEVFPNDMEILCEEIDAKEINFRSFGPVTVTKYENRCHLTIEICELEEGSCNV